MNNFMIRAMMGVATFTMLPFVAHADQVLQPTKIPRADALGAAFLRPEAMKRPGRNGEVQGWPYDFRIVSIGGKQVHDAILQI